MLTDVAAEGLKITRPGSKSEVLHPAYSDGPRRYDAAIENVAGLTVSGVVGNVDVGEARHLRVTLVGTTPGYGELRLRLTRDAFPW